MAIDIDGQSDGVPYRDEMLGRDFHSFAGLPLVVGDRVVGYFALYTDEAGFFDAAEMQLLSELADELSFALDHMEKEARLQSLERLR